MFVGSTGSVARGDPVEMLPRLIGTQPVPSIFFCVDDAAQWYVMPVGGVEAVSPVTPAQLVPAVDVAVGSTKEK